MGPGPEEATMVVIKKTNGAGGFVFSPGKVNLPAVYCDDIEEAREWRTRREAEESCSTRNEEVVPK